MYISSSNFVMKDLILIKLKIHFISLMEQSLSL